MIIFDDRNIIKHTYKTIFCTDRTFLPVFIIYLYIIIFFFYVGKNNIMIIFDDRNIIKDTYITISSHIQTFII